MKGVPFRYRVSVVVERVGGKPGERREVELTGTVRAPLEGNDAEFGMKALRRSLHDASHQAGKRR
jgi:hypothetical protein